VPVKPYFFAKVDHGRLIHDNPEMWFGYLRGFEQKAVRLTVEVRPKPRNMRSNEQNAYLFGVVYAILSEETGHEVDELHEICKIKFNGKIVEGEKIGQSTTKLDSGQFTDYIERIRKWAAMDLGIHIPDPHTVQL